jgi:predicted aspartyl protease
MLLVILTACAMFYQTAERNYAESASETQSETKPTEIPMQFRGPMPAVEVMVNGKGPFLFAIDTGGAGMARVDISLGEQLALKPTGKIRAGDGSGTNAVELDTVALDSIKVGNIEFHDVRAIMRNYNQAPNLPKIDGILGFNLFADYLLTLDYPGKRVRIERGELPASDGAEILSFENPRGVPVVDLKVGDLIVKAHIDSGNTGEIVLPTSLAEKLPLAAEPVTVGRAKTVSNEFEIKQAPLNGTVWFGRFEIQKPLINFAEIFRQSNIGSRTLSAFSLTFDQKNKRVKLARTESAKPASSVKG